MIITIPQTPDNIVAIKASGEITIKDYEDCVIPEVKVKVNEFHELNFLFYLDCDLGDFSLKAMMKDIALGLKNLAKWNRVAIVSDEKSVKHLTDVFSVMMPGEYKTYAIENLQDAIDWCATGNENNQQ